MKNPRAQQLLAQAFQLLSSGQLREAQRACRKAVQARPDLPEAHLLLSEIHHQGGDAVRARECADRALRLRPGWSEAYVALGNAEALAGNPQAAERHFRSAIAAGSPGAGVHANLGHVLRRQGRLEEARAAYELALSREPNALELQLNAAMVLSELGEKTQALERAHDAAEGFPDSPQAHLAVGNALADLGRHGKALPAYARALELDPGFPAAQLNQARAFFATGQKAQAAAALGELLRRDPAASEPRELLLRVLQSDRRFVEMEAMAREAMARHPESVVYPHQLGVSLWWQGRHDEALAAFAMLDRVAQDRTGDDYQVAKLDHASSLLACGHWREGWEAYHHRASRVAGRAKFPRLVEDPRAIAHLARPARILVVAEQGLGDELFFLRFAQPLRERGHRLLGCYDSRLQSLLRAMAGMFEVLTSTGDATPIDADFTLLSGDLPLACGQEFAAPVALPVDSRRRASFEAQLRQFGPPPYIGVTWRAGVLPDERKGQAAFYLSKEVPPGELGAALRPLSGTVVILQRRPAADDRERFLSALGRPALDLNSVNDDLNDALAVLSLLDDYVGVSNTNTHLRAGCPGKVARVLVPSNPEWRWGVHGARSPWFPEFSVYRQDRRAGWAPALEALQRELG